MNRIIFSIIVVAGNKHVPKKINTIKNILETSLSCR